MQLGADPHQLEVLARAHRAAGRELAATITRLDRRIVSVDWRGPAARVRIDELRSELRALCRRAVDGLERAARGLDAQATAQRVASVAPAPSATVHFDGRGDGRWVWRTGRAAATTVVLVVPGVGTDLGDAGRLHREAESVRAAIAARADRRSATADRRSATADRRSATADRRSATADRRSATADRRSGRAGPSDVTGPADIAVLSWLGYDPPDGLLGGLGRSSATDGADALVAEVASLRGAGAARIVVVGHSYGGLVAATAMERGVLADEVVLLGAPGLGPWTGEDPTARRRLWAAAAPGDAISTLASLGLVHGPDPLDVARRLATSGRGHGSYLQDPVLLDALAAIALGPSAGPRSPVA